MTLPLHVPPTACSLYTVILPKTAPLILATSPLFRLTYPAPPEHKHRPLVMSDTVPSDNRRTQCLTLTDRLPGHLTTAHSRDNLILLNMHAIML